MRSIVVFLAAAICLQTILGFHFVPHHARSGLIGKRFKSEPLSTSDLRYIRLPLDHENPSSELYDNRYYVDFSRWDGGGPCFFIMGGEAPNGGIGESYITYLADKYAALIVSIEHRFYGDSVPDNNMDVDHLKFLTSKQALADAAALIDYINQQHNRCVWFAFGGSYSGALSAWFREKYPSHTSGALSSSGVVNAILNFTQFDEQVATAVGDECADNIRYISAAFQDAESKGQGREARALFGARSDLDFGDFAYMLADSAAMSDQYGAKKDLCEAIKNVQSNYTYARQTFATFTNTHWGEDFGGSCFYDSECVKSDRSRWQPTARSWWWQKCYEVAYFQNAPSSKSLRLPILTMDYHRKRCAFMFGNGIFPDTTATNNYYGGASPNATKVFFSDFSDDPWQQASVRKELSDTLPYEMVTCDGCGHCMDFHAPRDSDPEPLQKERERFEKYLQIWL